MKNGSDNALEKNYDQIEQPLSEDISKAITNYLQFYKGAILLKIKCNKIK